jgi:hypothetical protein
MKILWGLGLEGKKSSAGSGDPRRGFYQATYNDPIARDGGLSVVIIHNWQQLAVFFVAMAACGAYNDPKSTQSYLDLDSRLFLSYNYAEKDRVERPIW